MGLERFMLLGFKINLVVNPYMYYIKKDNMDPDEITMSLIDRYCVPYIISLTVPPVSLSSLIMLFQSFHLASYFPPTRVLGFRAHETSSRACAAAWSRVRAQEVLYIQ